MPCLGTILAEPATSRDGSCGLSGSCKVRCADRKLRRPAVGEAGKPRSGAEIRVQLDRTFETLACLFQAALTPPDSAEVNPERRRPGLDPCRFLKLPGSAVDI